MNAKNNIFNAITIVLGLMTSCQNCFSTGMYWYKRHPIYKVDIMGVVVKRQENVRCFIYAGILCYITIMCLKN